MGKADITEKTLLDYNDVFADIVNVLLFNGDRIVQESDLRPTRMRSQYKADDGEVHEQERDVSKLIEKQGVIMSLVGFENQTKQERFMPVRLIGYDGQSYRSQLLAKRAKRVYPVISIVLYFGMDHWRYSRHLDEVIDISDNLRPFVSDYEMKNLYEIAFLTPEQVSMFRSDFRYVADYFVQKRIDHNYKPSPDTIKHVDETLKLMSILTGDDRFNRAVKAVPDSRKGENSMEAILDRIEARGKEQGEIIGEDNHAIKVYNNCLNRGMSEKDAIAISEISDSALQRARKGRQNRV